MRNYYVQIYEYLQRFVTNIVILDKKGIDNKNCRLSITDLLILKLLGNEHKKKMFEVMNALNIDRNTFKTIINRLISKGYISKTRCEDDRRAYILELTDKGKSFFAEAINKEKEILFTLLDDFTFNEEKAILKFLVKLEMLNK
ncbi:MAG: MarR family winged helix-turn-helix transcriptional regulator [Natronincolaceae bacterium]|jgi:DNA-binding MarR family transcriptional regulator|nr:MarR family transcriptional regulator [Bacillota bacterium]NLK90879.1 winged helix DNA-binding protein [Clostridiales bacterium]